MLVLLSTGYGGRVHSAQARAHPVMYREAYFSYVSLTHREISLPSGLPCQGYPQCLTPHIKMIFLSRASTAVAYPQGSLMHSLSGKLSFPHPPPGHHQVYASMDSQVPLLQSLPAAYNSRYEVGCSKFGRKSSAAEHSLQSHVLVGHVIASLLAAS